MDEPNELENIITAELALSDVLDNIFQYLKISDLNRASSVCQSWRSVALKEISRRGPERLLIPSIFSKEFKDTSFHIGNLISAKPYVTLLFIGPSNRERSIRNLETEISESYKSQLPNYLVAVGVDESMMDEKVINSCPGLLGSPNGILGLFFPLYKDLNIKIGLQPLENFYRSDYGTSDSLPDIRKNLKPIFIMFSSPHSYNNLKEKTLEAIRERFAQKSYTLWGGVFDDSLVIVRDESLKQKLGMLVLCLTGTSLESWSTVIDCRIDKNEVDKKLLDFRENIKFKRVTIGLVCGPRYVDNLNTTSENSYKNSHELMHAIKSCFPTIPFNGIFNYGYHGHFGVDSTSEDTEQLMLYEMTMCLLILTYN